MPWQDVHCRIEGPSVYDVSRNFIDRWNGQQAYVAETPALAEVTRVRPLLEAAIRWTYQQARDAGLDRLIDIPVNPSLSVSQPQPVWINAPELLPEAPSATPGGMSVQVLRSAASRMVQQEAVGRRHAGINLPLPPGIDNASVQTNCKEAMLQAISSAQHFIYIENQFFQSAFGREGELDLEKFPLSGPMACLRDPITLRQDFVERVQLRAALAAQDFTQLNWSEINAIARDPREEAQTFLNDMLAIWGVNAQGWITHKLGEVQTSLLNGIAKALADRIGRAIDERQPFHVYLVLPVHPEGALNVPNIMHQVSLTMQSLVFGENSLIRSIQRRMALRSYLDLGLTPEEAKEVIERPKNREPNAPRVYQDEDWTRYLTLLNLRTWEKLGERVVTEQIYVHSKLLIADDRVAILGSANINDRSLQGERDSELAVIVRDSTQAEAMLDGQCTRTVSKAIQQTNQLSYLSLYTKAFDFIPQNTSPVQLRMTPLLPKGKDNKDGNPASIWPTFAYRSLEENQGGELLEPMPHEERFWRSSTLAPVKSFAPPEGIRGFICALPTNWTRGENNDSGISLAVLAQLLKSSRNTYARTHEPDKEGSQA
jgi:phosphatidylserine/phosphatidylglycerophosphate/cardiolipin synthase-like enzyme